MLVFYYGTMKEMLFLDMLLAKKYMKVIDEDFFEYIKNKPGIIIYKTN